MKILDHVKNPSKYFREITLQRYYNSEISSDMEINNMINEYNNVIIKINLSFDQTISYVSPEIQSLINKRDQLELSIKKLIALKDKSQTILYNWSYYAPTF